MFLENILRTYFGLHQRDKSACRFFCKSQPIRIDRKLTASPLSAKGRRYRTVSGQSETHIKGVLSRGSSSMTADTMGIGDDCELTDDPDVEYDLFLDSFEKNFPNSPNKPIILFRTSRGCWWAGRSKSGGCTFCGLNTSGKDFSSVDSDRAAERIQRLFRYADRVSCLEAVDNTMPQSLPREVLSNLKVPDRLSLFFETRPTVKDRDLDTMAKAHVLSIQPGIRIVQNQQIRILH